MDIVDKFFMSTIRSSDLRYSWSVARYHPIARRAILEAPDEEVPIEEAVEIGTALAKKHTSRRWQYVLYRRSAAVDKLIKAISRKSAAERNKVIAESRNWEVLEKSIQDNCAKTRVFSSLAAAQKWADKNGIAIDVYGLYAKSRAGERA